MKPISLETRDRIEARRQKALDDIELSHEKEAYVPAQPFEIRLPVDEIHAKADAMLQGVIGKL